MTYDLSSLDSRDYDRYCDDAGSHVVDDRPRPVDPSGSVKVGDLLAWTKESDQVPGDFSFSMEGVVLEVTDPDTFIVRREDNDKRFTVKRSWLIDT